MIFLMQVYFSLQKSLFNVKKYGARVKGLGTVNFDITPRSFTVILLITFDFQRFLT